MRDLTNAAGIEAHLACGDTVSCGVEPRVGQYKFCIHCDGKRKVESVTVHELTPPQPHYLDGLSSIELLELQGHLVKGHHQAVRLDIYLTQNRMTDDKLSALCSELYELADDAYRQGKAVSGKSVLL